MTRWVRSGNTQKHKKMPGNATKWGEFDNQKTNEYSLKKQVKKQDSNFERESNAVYANSNISVVHQSTESCDIKAKSKKQKRKKSESGIFSQTKLPSTLEDELACKTPLDKFEQSSNAACGKSNDSFVNKSTDSYSTKVKSKKQKSKKNKSGISCESETKELSSVLKNEFECKTSLDNFEQSSNAACGKSNDPLVQENANSASLETKSKKQKCKKNKRDFSSEFQNKELTLDSQDELEYETSLDKMNSPKKSLKNNNSENNKQHSLGNGLPNSSETEAEKMSSPKAVKTKKEIYLKKLQRKRDKVGIMLLPPKIERKLKNIRKRLQEKGYPPHTQKEILRKERRKEELLFRKTINPSKLCFHCREAGHLFADCPMKKGHSNQKTGICFKCGSSEHTSYKCPEKVQGFPFAKCFICKEQGHISKDCPQNKHGVYPKGGRCNLCGNVNHLKKDCPSLRKRANEESSITLHTINETISVDAEMMEEETKKNKAKRPKLVKF